MLFENIGDWQDQYSDSTERELATLEQEGY